ncbi:transcription elongation GreA/GreB family factor [Evansella vedderi]|uniref:Transcription elongation GreA/GreB family factor n=1 Tax=Evansella vedderi TaxID=38282 RepID=A0ABU0A0C2_9BACI|nr:GreA/GreB family elongation factor [Evansella vedderi]MDQ0256421.1 transcription elongation GreA/GreB family factor [Evansella vedderi]
MILRKAVMEIWLKKRIDYQLEYFVNNKKQIVSELSRNSNNNSDWEPEQFIDQYRERLTTLKEIELDQFPSLPFVIINSRVTLYQPTKNDTMGITICFPEEENVEFGLYSYLSPFGKKLLLKEVGAVIYGEINNESREVTIENIEYSSSY